MAGKILKITSNDLYGNVDERRVVVFSCFEHTKYMNNYVVFAFEGEYNKKKLCYGSVHLKNDSIVIFAVKNDIKKYIDEFILEYTSDKLENFKLLNFDDIEKVELVSYNEMEYDNLELLDRKSIVREVVREEKEQKKTPIFLYSLIIMLVLFACGITFLYFNQGMFVVKYKELVCVDKLYDQELMLYYDLEKDIKFNRNDKVSSIDVVKTYIFLDSDVYYDFRENNKHEQYFNNGEAYKYINDSLKLRLMYQEKSVIDDYDEMVTYMEREGFSCVKKEYEK